MNSLNNDYLIASPVRAHSLSNGENTPPIGIKQQDKGFRPLSQNWGQQFMDRGVKQYVSCSYLS